MSLLPTTNNKGSAHLSLIFIILILLGVVGYLSLTMDSDAEQGSKVIPDEDTDVRDCKENIDCALVYGICDEITSVPKKFENIFYQQKEESLEVIEYTCEDVATRQTIIGNYKTICENSICKAETVMTYKDIQPDYSPNSTIQSNENAVMIDFGKCTEDRKRIDIAFGSYIFAVEGMNNAMCTLHYGREIEDPNWNGNLQTTCKVPSDRGKLSFTTANESIDLSAISEYCYKNNGVGESVCPGENCDLDKNIPY